jgi:hypothetical protein
MRNGSEAIASSSTSPLQIASCSHPSQSFSVMMMMYSFSAAAAFPTSSGANQQQADAPTNALRFMDCPCREETSGDLPMIYILTSATFSRSSYF